MKILKQVGRGLVWFLKLVWLGPPSIHRDVSPDTRINLYQMGYRDGLHAGGNFMVLGLLMKANHEAQTIPVDELIPARDKVFEEFGLKETLPV